MKDFSPIAFTEPVIGFPARIVVITRTDGVIIRVAESEETISISGDSFSVVPGFELSAIKHTSNGEMPSCQIDAVHGNGATFNTADLDIGLFDGATVQIYKVDLLDLSRKGLEFTGSIANISYDTENLVTFAVKGPAVSARILMTQKRSPMCRTDLFSPLCQLVASSFDVAATVATIINSYNFTVSIVSPPADGYFNQGVLVTSAGAKFEIANWVQSSQTVTAYLQSNRFLTVGMSLTLYPGCNKTDGPGGCGKFSNWANFQGENHFLGTAAAAQQV